MPDIGLRGPVLVLAPHTDDGEIGAGGTIARAVEAGLEVHYVALSDARVSLPPGWEPDTLAHECRAATDALGLPQNRVRILDFDTRTFPDQRQAILDTLIGLRRELAPATVLLPASTDVHQDHATVHAEGVRCFKKATLLGYEEPWNQLTTHSHCLVRLEEGHVAHKVRALAHYRTQAGRHYMDGEVVRGHLRSRGTQVDHPFAEAFEVLRWVL
jgi:LmbE family N-acetylglucosaminyl deacetylase